MKSRTPKNIATSNVKCNGYKTIDIFYFGIAVFSIYFTPMISIVFAYDVIFIIILYFIVFYRLFVAINFG